MLQNRCYRASEVLFRSLTLLNSKKEKKLQREFWGAIWSERLGLLLRPLDSPALPHGGLLGKRGYGDVTYQIAPGVETCALEDGDGAIGELRFDLSRDCLVSRKHARQVDGVRRVGEESVGIANCDFVLRQERVQPDVVIAQKRRIGPQDALEFRKPPCLALAVVQGEPSAVTHGFHAEGKFLFNQPAALVAIHRIVRIQRCPVVPAANEKSSRAQHLGHPRFRLAAKIRVKVDEHIEAAYDAGFRQVA